MEINSVKHLDELGLRELSSLHPALADKAGRVQLAVLSKYPDGAGIWRRWISVDDLVPVVPLPTDSRGRVIIGSKNDLMRALTGDPHAIRPNGANVFGVRGDIRPYIMLSRKFTDSSAADYIVGATQEMVNGWYVPTADVSDHKIRHEGLHPVENTATKTAPVMRELQHRVSVVLAEPWEPANHGRRRFKPKSVAPFPATQHSQ